MVDDGGGGQETELQILSREELEERVRRRTADLRNIMDAMADVLVKLEATPESVRALVEESRDLGDGEYVQSRGELLARDAPYEACREGLYAVLDRLIR